MTRDEAKLRIGRLIKYNPRDGRQTWVHAELLAVEGDRAHIAPAHAKNKTKWVQLNECRCWKARDAQIGIVDEAPTIEKIVVQNAANFTADKMAGVRTRDRFIDFKDRPALFPSTRNLTSSVVKSDIAEGARVAPPSTLQDDEPTACIICEAVADLDSDGLCPKCSEEYNRKAESTPEQIYAPIQPSPEPTGTEPPNVALNAPEPRPTTWYIIDLPSRTFFNGMRFIGIPEPEGLLFAKQYTRSQDAHRARTVAANNRDLANVYVIEQAQAEALIKETSAPAPALSRSLESLIASVQFAKDKVNQLTAELSAATIDLANARAALREFKQRIDEALGD